MIEKNSITPGTLYLVATPIGNLSDITERAKKILCEVDFIACEDTRQSAKLLAALSLPKKNLVSYYEHNKISSGEKIIAALKEGKCAALVSDAGTPAISDPGEDLVRACREKNIQVTSVPGACAAITALTLSGFSTKEFLFAGFLNGSSESETKARALELSTQKQTIILYEAPHRLAKTLTTLCKTFKETREIALCRELTKINEEVVVSTIKEALEKLNTTPARGEYVLVIKGLEKTIENQFWEYLSIPQHVQFYEKQGLSKMEAIKTVAKDRGVSKNTIYKEMI